MKSEESKTFLLISPFERSGTTWTLDFVDKIGRGYTELFKQHLKPGTLDENEGGFRKYWLKNFEAWQKFPEIQLFKETSLFLDLKYFLNYFPSDTPTMILSRDFRGIVSSFKKGNLYQRWNYIKKFEDVKGTVLTSRKELEWLVNTTDVKNWLDVMISLFLINSLEIHNSILSKDRKILRVTYEELVVDYDSAIQKICDFLGCDRTLIVQNETSSGKSSDFNTTQKKLNPRDWLKVLTLGELDFIEKRFGERLSEVREKFDEKTVDSLISLGVRIEKVHGSEVGEGALIRSNLLLTEFTEASLTREEILNESKLVLIKGGAFKMGKAGDRRCVFERQEEVVDFRISVTPVTNLQFASFMNFLKEKGIENEINGNYLFLDPYMIAERGGRIFLNDGRYVVLKGFENHPVNWVNWIGAETFCRYLGYRLPAESEWEWVAGKVTSSEKENLNHTVGDTQSVNEMPEEEFGIKGWWGNVKTWCWDWYYPGYEVKNDNFIMKSVRGGSWNSGKPEIYERNYKAFLMGSRGIGIRLVDDGTSGEFNTNKIKDLVQKLENGELLNMGLGETNKFIEKSIY